MEARQPASSRFAGALLPQASTKPGAKKLVIKQYAEKPKLPESFDADTWSRLSGAVAALLQHQPASHSFEELYKDCEDRCSQAANLTEETRTRLSDIIAAYADSVVGGQLRDVDSSAGSLVRVGDCWSLYCSQLLHIRNIFLVLDRRLHSDSTQACRSIEELGVLLFKKHWELHPSLAQNVLSGCLATIRAERTGQLIDRQLLRRLLAMLVSLGCFTTQFKPLLAADLERFFAEESARMLCDSEVSVFLLYCERRLKEEAENLGAIMSPCDSVDMVRTVQKVLLESNIDAILSGGLASLIDASRFQDLSRVHALLGLVNAHAALRLCFVSHIKATGLPLVQTEAKDKEMIVSLLDLRKRMSDIVEQSFGGARIFRDGVKEAFDSFINSRQNKPAEMLAKYMSAVLRGEVVSDVKEEELLDRSMELFRHLQGKDMFEEFYKAELARRLLLQRFSSIDLEKAAIARLKTECGAAFTTKLEKMFQDCDVSSNLLQQYEQHHESCNQPSHGIDLKVTVTTKGVWPEKDEMAGLIIPDHMLQRLEQYRCFYLSLNPQRRVAWMHSASTCVIRANFPMVNDSAKGNRELVVSLYQALVLLLFNTRDSVAFADMGALTGMEDKDLRLTLLSLSMGKPGTRVLKKTPVGPSVGDEDVFAFNDKFTNKQLKIKINSVQSRESVEEQKEVSEKVFADRQYSVDAAIVRIMKSRKRLDHGSLMTELMGQLKFACRTADVKKRLESLIEREYLVRDEEDGNFYIYQ